MDDVMAFFGKSFPPNQREYAACMRPLAEHLAAVGASDGLQAVPFDSMAFGLFPPGRGADPTSPFIGLWFDTPDPMY